MITKVGGFNPEFQCGCDDDEVEWRLYKQGLRTFFSKKAITYVMDYYTVPRMINRAYRNGYYFGKMVQIHGDDVWIYGKITLQDVRSILEKNSKAKVQEIVAEIANLEEMGWRQNGEPVQDETLYDSFNTLIWYFRCLGLMQCLGGEPVDTERVADEFNVA